MRENEPREPADYILELRDLRIRSSDPSAPPIVNGVDLAIGPGETVGLVGESGSGKSLSCLAAMGLLPPSLRPSGSVLLDGRDLASIGSRQLRAMRGTTAAMIFQEPMSSLNPVLTVGVQLSEAMRHGGHHDRKQRYELGIELLEQVGISEPARRWHQFAHELSGGMCQRVMIAIALAGSPQLLIADEPTTALDVTIQAQIIDLLAGLVRDSDMSLLLVTHDLGVVAQACERICVMYGGHIVEHGSTREVLAAPEHPYTEGLLRSLPDVDAEVQDLQPIGGTVPTIRNMPDGCRFNTRCPLVIDRCRSLVPPLLPTGSDRSIACWVRGAA